MTPSARFEEHAPGPIRLLALVLRDVALALVYGGLIGLGVVLLTALLVEELQPFGPLQADADRIVRGALAFISLGFVTGIVVRFFVATPLERMLLTRQELRRRELRPDLVAPVRDRTPMTDDSALGGIRGVVTLLGGIAGVLAFCCLIVLLIDPDDDPEFVGGILLTVLGVTALCFVVMNTFRRGGPYWWWSLRRTVSRGWTPELLTAASRAERAERRGPVVDLDSTRHRRLGRVISVVQTVASIAFALSGITLIIAAKGRQPCRGCAPREFGPAGESAIDALAAAVLVFAAVALVALALSMLAWLVRRLLRRAELGRAARVADTSATPADLAEELHRVSVSVLFGMGVIAIAGVVAAYLATAMLVAGDSGIRGSAELVAPLGSALAVVGIVAAVAVIVVAAGHVSGVRHRNRLRRRWTPGDPPAPTPRRRRRAPRS